MEGGPQFWEECVAHAVSCLKIVANEATGQDPDLVAACEVALVALAEHPLGESE